MLSFNAISSFFVYFSLYSRKRPFNQTIITNQRCGSARVRIKLKGRIRIRIKVISWIWIRVRINLQMTSQSVWDKSLFEHFFKVLGLYLEARIRIRIRIKFEGRIRTCIKVTSRIRICIKLIRIRNTDYNNLPEGVSGSILEVEPPELILH
jgi:hypothetical protein